ncbi:Uncharacterised protein [Collinsella aerofaciens]|uniref:Uncharacterized protein n=1 Tax=Collinsella aerofaciens TaxID=74426 RepID=A0A6N3CY12_9ACTN
MAWRIEIDKVGQRSMRKLDKQIAKEILADRVDIHRSGTRLGLAAFSKPMRQARTMNLRTKLEIPLQESFKFAPFNLVFQHPLTPICQSWPSRANRFDLFFQGLA